MAICILFGILGIVFGMGCWIYTKRTLIRIDKMLSSAIDGSFRETRFDESMPSMLETKMARFLNGSTSSARNLERQRAAIQTLISDISHQTKTPISNILLYASLLSENESHGMQAEQLKTLSQQAEKLAFLIDNLVKASRMETGIITAVPKKQAVRTLIEQVICQNAAKAQKKQISLIAEKTDASAKFDRHWTEEALCNVVDNAIKYTSMGGDIRISVKEFEMFCRIDVSDNGKGIEESEQAKIFARFYRGKNVQDQDGLGIGLYLSREILQSQGGYIKVKSEAEKGSTFSLYLPRE